MKGRAAYIFPAFSLLFLFSCSIKNKNQMPPAPAVSQTQSEEQLPSPNDDTVAYQREALPLPEKDADSSIDVDLTKMNANMIYSYIFEMIIDPDSYAGKTIKVEGFFNSFLDQESGERYFAVIIPDALACCKQGMEFKWTGNHSYPQDYPEENQKITITGKYCTSTMEGDISYSYLQVTSLEM